MKVGDVQHFVCEDRIALARANRMRGTLERAAHGTHRNGRVSEARVILAGMHERDRRAACPVEQAKAHLRRKGFNVFCASVIDGPSDRFVIAGREGLLTRAELLAMAERHGWERGGGR